MLKLLDGQTSVLETHIMESHSYDVPEWIVVPVSQIGEKYLSWAQGDSTSFPL